MATYEASPWARILGHIRTAKGSSCGSMFATTEEERLKREQFQYNHFQAFGVAEATVQSQMGAFTSAFAPVEDKEAAIKIFLDIFGLGLSLISAGVWNKSKSC